MFQPTYDKYNETLTHFPIKYVSHRILNQVDEGRVLHLSATKESASGQEASVSACQTLGETGLGLEARYKTTIKNTLVDMSSTNRTLSIFADLGTSYHAHRREGCSCVRTSVLQSFLGVQMDKKAPHSKFLSTAGIFVHRRNTKLGVLFNHNHGLCEELQRGTTVEVKVSKSCPKTGTALDLTARYTPNDSLPQENNEEGTCPYNQWTSSNPFNLQLPHLSLLISRRYRDVLFQVGANREAGKGCPFFIHDGNLTMTYTPRKSHWTLVSRIGMDFSNREPVPSVAVGAQYECCERLRAILNLDSEGKLGFGLKSKEPIKGLNLNLKGLLDLPGANIRSPFKGSGLSLKVGLDL